MRVNVNGDGCVWFGLLDSCRPQSLRPFNIYIYVMKPVTVITVPPNGTD